MEDRPVLDMSIDFEDFMRTRARQIIRDIRGDEQPAWGMMSVHHMIEHLVFPLNFATGVIQAPVFTPEEKLPRNREFLHSAFGLMRHFKMPLLPKDENPPLMTTSLEDAKVLLFDTIDNFQTAVDDPAFTTANHPIFGKLTRPEWYIFQYKHFMHHFGQFGLV
jgi:oxepin-CoA hydrolase/3-oxo-5,6-dehydrosuberyl-CoA semialdehyde dehydrogenase